MNIALNPEARPTSRFSHVTVSAVRVAAGGSRSGFSRLGTVSKRSIKCAAQGSESPMTVRPEARFLRHQRRRAQKVRLPQYACELICLRKWKGQGFEDFPHSWQVAHPA